MKHSSGEAQASATAAASSHAASGEAAAEAARAAISEAVRQGQELCASGLLAYGSPCSLMSAVHNISSWHAAGVADIACLQRTARPLKNMKHGKILHIPAAPSLNDVTNYIGWPSRGLSYGTQRGLSSCCDVSSGLHNLGKLGFSSPFRAR